MYTTNQRRVFLAVLAAILLLPLAWAGAEVFVQAPPDTDGVDTDGDGIVNNDYVNMHLTAGDGFVRMADGKDLYCFGFANVTGINGPEAMMAGMLAAEFPGPTIRLKQGQRFYLTLTNAGMMMRPDLFDPHTVHFHGFPNAASVFDGEPMASISINMGNSLTYYYKINDPGTYMYHCHVEATEHMQMGMLANLCVDPIQNNLADGTALGAFTHHTGYKYAYNDGDGSTHYDVDILLQLAGFDPRFHEEHIAIQPLPFAAMRDDYATLNGRGYPDTVNPGPITNVNGAPSQPVNSVIAAMQGQKVLLRLSSLSTTDHYTVTAGGLPMRVVGTGARILRGPGGADLSYQTASVSLGGGQAFDVIIDTTGVPPGTYHVYTTNMNHLSNDTEDNGGIMTELVVLGPGGEGERLAAIAPTAHGQIALSAPFAFTWLYYGTQDFNYRVDVATTEAGLGTAAGISFLLPAQGQTGPAQGFNRQLTDPEWNSLLLYLNAVNSSTFYWRVVALDGGGAAQRTSQTVLAATDLGMILPISPVAGAPAGDMGTPAFVAANGTLDAFAPAPQVSFYYSGGLLNRFTVEFAANPTFTGTVVRTAAFRTDGVQNLTTAQWLAIRRLLANQPRQSQWRIFWRVKGTAGRTVVYSETRFFMLDGGTIALAGPGDGTAFSLAGAAPVLSWTDTKAPWHGPIRGRNKYQIQVSSSPDFTTTTTWSSPVAGVGASPYTIPAATWRQFYRSVRVDRALLTGGPVTLYWRVIGRDPDLVMKVFSNVRTLQMTN